ncbi:unnamed protein product [Adineta steineri]|uniref:Uncharacterized protein n=1 Tax=Adineta steineri TaxID=433720 RepID=A0A813Q0M8_9BILA|nr:unnamed protein product [Adineta steineri]
MYSSIRVAICGARPSGLSQLHAFESPRQNVDEIRYYQRYENHSKSRNNRSTGFLAKEELQANPIRSAMIQPKINRQVNQKSQSLKVNNTDPNAGINQKIAEELKLKQAAIRDAHEERIRRQQSRMGQLARINSGGTGGALRRYENHSKSRNNRSTGFLAKEELQANPIRSAIIQPKINRQVNQKSQSLKVNNTDPNAGFNQKTAEELKLRQAAIRDAHEERIRRQQSRMGQIARINSGGTGGALRWQVD